MNYITRPVIQNTQRERVISEYKYQLKCNLIQLNNEPSEKNLLITYISGTSVMKKQCQMKTNVSSELTGSHNLKISAQKPKTILFIGRHTVGINYNRQLYA